ncbi:hypothetical protein ES703_74162 [subsurface metagenome]
MRVKVVLPMVGEEVELLSKLVLDELDRKCAVIDDTILRVYDVLPAKHTDTAIAVIKSDILELVRSPLADLERKLACVEVKPEEEPAEEPAETPEPEPEETPEPGKEPAKSKA